MLASLLQCMSVNNAVKQYYTTKVLALITQYHPISHYYVLNIFLFRTKFLFFS